MNLDFREKTLQEKWKSKWYSIQMLPDHKYQIVGKSGEIYTTGSAWECNNFLEWELNGKTGENEIIKEEKRRAKMGVIPKNAFKDIITKAS